MTATLITRLLGRSGSSPRQREAFTLPGELQGNVRLLLVDSGDLLDLLFAMPLVEEVRRRHPEARLGLVCEESASHLALSSARFHELVVYQLHQLKPKTKPFQAVVEALAQDPWDVAVLLGHGRDEARELLAQASGARLRLGPDHADAYPRINCAVRALPNGHYPSHRTHTYGRLLGVPLEEVALRWPLPEARLKQAAQLVHFNKPRKEEILVGVDPGLAKTGALIAPENLALLINHMVRAVQGRVLVLTADPDPTRVTALTAQLRAPMLDLPRPTLHEKVLLLAQCDLFVTGNTDFFHYAAAMGVPTLALFTPADTDQWIPPQATSFALMRCESGQPLRPADFMEKVQSLRR